MLKTILNNFFQSFSTSTISLTAIPFPTLSSCASARSLSILAAACSLSSPLKNLAVPTSPGSTKNATTAVNTVNPPSNKNTTCHPCTFSLSTCNNPYANNPANAPATEYIPENNPSLNPSEYFGYISDM